MARRSSSQRRHRRRARGRRLYRAGAGHAGPGELIPPGTKGIRQARRKKMGIRASHTAEVLLICTIRLENVLGGMVARGKAGSAREGTHRARSAQDLSSCRVRIVGVLRRRPSARASSSSRPSREGAPARACADREPGDRFHVVTWRPRSRPRAPIGGRCGKSQRRRVQEGRGLMAKLKAGRSWPSPSSHPSAAGTAYPRLSC